jgi:FkbM family methyltransferase
LQSRQGISGAKLVGKSSNGNYLLELNTPSELGKSGSILEMPYDEVIFRSVQMRGNWATEETLFFTNFIDSSIFSGTITFLDIGANVGLSTRQLLNTTDVKMDCILVEPLGIHLEAIHKNLDLEFPNTNIEIFPFALGENNGSQILYSDVTNSARASLVFESYGFNRTIKREIEVMGIEVFEKAIYKPERDFLFKCDTEGFESVICSRFSNTFWSKVCAAIIEISPSSLPDTDEVKASLSFFKKFSKMSWDSKLKNQIQIGEISDFWLSKSTEVRNLYLSR